MATKTFPLPKRMRTRSMDQDKDVLYNSDEDLDSDPDFEESPSCSSSSDEDEDTDISEFGSNSSMDHSGIVHEPGVLMAKDGTKWVEDFSDHIPRNIPTSLLNHLPALTDLSRNAKSLTDIFNLFFTEELIIHILTMTNQKLRNYTSSRPEFLKNRYFDPITLTELYAFLGLFIETGVLRLHREPLDNLYSSDTNKSRPIFQATMPRDRFKTILRFLRFDDESTRKDRQQADYLAPIRPVLDAITANLLTAYSPGAWVTVDEHLCRYRGRCFFKQFIPSKPDRYGIKIYVLADSKTYYPITFEVYCGMKCVSNKTTDLVMRLASVLKPGHAVCGDNYFSSLHLSQSLMNSRIHYLGTLRKNRLGVPKSINDNKGLPNYSSRFFYNSEKNISLLSYITRKNTNVLLLSNLHFNKVVPQNSKKLRPTVILDYNSHKGGVDKLDQMVKEFRMYRANRRWPAVLFFDILGFVCHASWVIFCLLFPNDPIVVSKNRREFLYRLGKELLTPLIISRKDSSTFKFLPHLVKKSIESNLVSNIPPVIYFQHHISSNALNSITSPDLSCNISPTIPLSDTSITTPLGVTSSIAPLGVISTIAPLGDSSSTTPLGVLSTIAPLSDTSITTPLGDSSSTTPLGVLSTIAPLSDTSITTPLGDSSSTTPLGVLSTIAPLSDTSITTPLGDSSSTTPLGVLSTIAPLSDTSITTPLGVTSTIAPLGDSSSAPLSDTSITTPLGVTSTIAPLGDSSSAPLSDTSITTPLGVISTRTPFGVASSITHVSVASSISLLGASSNTASLGVTSSTVAKKVILKKRCFICPRSKDRKYPSICYMCDLNVCNEHSLHYYICQYCNLNT